MRAGMLRHRVTIQARTDVADGHQGFTEGVTTIASRINAFIEPLRGAALDRAMQIDPRSTHQVTLRYRGDIKARQQLIFHDGPTDRIFEIVGSPNTIDERRREIHLTCREAS